MAEEARSPRQDAKGERGWPRGPRSLYLRRCDHGGFGFTLRHFIVYPPESYMVLAGDRRLGLRPGALDEPMDTIFVKNVKPGSPADRAGLHTGDRVVSVNGETISGHSYAAVVHKIHNSGPCLHLLVVPQEDDILQLYFNETAHRPESNLHALDPLPVAGMVRAGVGSGALPRWDGGGRRASDTYNMAPGDSSESMQGPCSALYPASVPGCRLSLDAGLIGRRESTSHEGSASSLGDHSSDDSVIYSRILKSCEQKDEFLKRPAGPLWPSSSGPPGPQGIKEFYARPQKLPPPHWPPNISQSPNHSPSRKERDDTPPRDRGFVCGGPVTNAPCDRRSKPGFVTSLGRIHETSPPSNPPHPQIQLVSQYRKQFESGSMPDRTSLHRSELARLSHKRMVPDVSVRAREFENRSDRRTRESRSLDSAAQKKNKSSEKECKQDKSKYGFSKSKCIPAVTPLSGNRMILVGGRNLHCDPPGEQQQQQFSYDESLRPRSNSAESWPGSDSWPQRHKAVRQDSYLAACHKPNLPAEAPNSVTEEAPAGAASLTSKPVLPAIHIEPVPMNPHKPEAVVEPVVSLAKPVRPTTLDIPRPNHPCPTLLDVPRPRPYSRPASLAQQSDAARYADGSGPDEESNSTPQGSPCVVWRDKSSNDTGSEEDRATRRVSYLKATWPDRMNVDSDPDASDSEPPVRPPRKWRPPLFPDDIQKIRKLFDEHSDKIKGVVVPRHSLCEDISLPDKENHHITQEGSLHCKLTLIDGKRATDRSWKQVWAVLRGPVLYLYKERRDSIPLSETPVGAEGGLAEQVDVRCVQHVGPAENYTKRKHVLRLNTESGTELLLQAADDSQMNRWINTIKEQANNNNTQNASSTTLSPPSNHKGLHKITSLRNRSPTGQSPVNKTRKPSQVVEPVASPKTKTWKGRMAKQFRRKQNTSSPLSPTCPTPYLEGATIGIPLEDCPPSTFSEYVPLLVELFTGIVEEKGLDVIGIYRVPGNTAAVSSLTEAANKGLDVALLDQDQRWKDVNVISSLLKSFFRRLPDSLLTTELYPSFIAADKITDPHRRMLTIRKLVHDLPDHHYETLKYLLLHLKKVVEHSSLNKMEARNLAIVFGPTLVRTADDNMVTMVTDMSHQCRIVETLILHVDWFIGDEAVERLSLEGEARMEPPDPTIANHNLLLGNIHKMEGMTKELSARDIVSSIICAANRKMMKNKNRKTHAVDDMTDHSMESKQRLEGKSKVQHRKERLGSTEESNVDVILTHQSAVEESVQLPPTNLPPSQSDNVAVSEGQTVQPQGDNGLIRTYAGLSATTQERIRRFELETKAMLQRDAARLRRTEPDSEREQSKRELETDDHANPSAIVKKIAEPGRVVKPLAIVPPSTEGRGRGRLKDEGAVLLRRGSSAENVNQPPPEKQANGNLKRFKSGKEQGEAGLGRCGSLDSVHDLTPSERPASHVSDEGGDLLVSLTSTFDAKLRSLLSSGANESAESPSSPAQPNSPFTDPSLHKACDKEEKEEMKEECCDEKNKLEISNLSTQTEIEKESECQSGSEPRVVRLYRSESVNKDERERERTPVSRSASLSKSDSYKLRRSESLNKDGRSESNCKLKRSDSLTKNEKTESNLNKRRQLEAGRWNNMVKLKRKTGSAIDRSIKRRHTVGGTKDFDKVNWLDNRQREAEEEGKKERRTSSPDLSSSRLATAAAIVLRPHSFAEKLCGIPLESHV